jgi:hypothetical protein
MWQRKNCGNRCLRFSVPGVVGSRTAGRSEMQARPRIRSAPTPAATNLALILSLVREGVGVGRIFGKRCRSCSISAWMGSADSPWRACIDYWAAVAGGMRGVERPPPGVPAALSGAHELDFDLIKPHRVFIPLQAYPRHVRHVEHASLNIVRLL